MCIQKASENDEIEVYWPSGGRRGYGVSRLMARGRKAADRYLQAVFGESEKAARKKCEAELRGDAWPDMDRAGDRDAAPARSG